VLKHEQLSHAALLECESGAAHPAAHAKPRAVNVTISDLHRVKRPPPEAPSARRSSDRGARFAPGCAARVKRSVSTRRIAAYTLLTTFSISSSRSSELLHLQDRYVRAVPFSSLCWVFSQATYTQSVPEPLLYASSARRAIRVSCW